MNIVAVKASVKAMKSPDIEKTINNKITINKKLIAVTIFLANPGLNAKATIEEAKTKTEKINKAI